MAPRIRPLLLAGLTAAMLTGCGDTTSELPILAFGEFGDPASSPYCLPYAVGETQVVNTPTCT